VVGVSRVHPPTKKMSLFLSVMYFFFFPVLNWLQTIYFFIHTCIYFFLFNWSGSTVLLFINFCPPADLVTCFILCLVHIDHTWKQKKCNVLSLHRRCLKTAKYFIFFKGGENVSKDLVKEVFCWPVNNVFFLSLFLKVQQSSRSQKRLY